MADLYDFTDDGAMSPETFVPGAARDWNKQAAKADVGTLRDIVRSTVDTAAYPGKVLASKTPIRTDEMVKPAFDLGGMSMGGGLVTGPAEEAGATLFSGAARRAGKGKKTNTPADFVDNPGAPYPQYAEEYPPVAPGVPTIDPKKPANAPAYMGKQSPPETEQFQKTRAKIQADMDKNGYQPYFNPEERFHADPSNYPQLDTADHLPAKKETIEKWTQHLDTPETRANLNKMYDAGMTVPNAQNWYMMGQLEREYVKEFGPELGRAKFRDNFAGAMAATTGGADPTANFLMAHYGNYMRNMGRDFPRWTPAEHEQVKAFSESQGRPYIDAKGKPVDKTGDIASFRLPFPVGGQYASGNLDKYDSVFRDIARGKDMGAALDEANPKRLDFMQSFTGNPDSFTWDKQMMNGTTAHFKKPWDMPENNSYGIMERIGREEAAKRGVPAQNFQDVAWAGQKKMSEEAKGKKFDYAGPMISHINESIERTHRLTGMPREEIVRRGLVRGEIPMYSGGGPSPLMPYLQPYTDPNRT